jgi:LmbE family N-acetylglucosaminyl deacetylase
VVAAHPDDEVAGCAGTITLHRLSGDEVSAIYVTDGRGSGALGLAEEEMARCRHEEAQRASSLLDTRCVWLGRPEHRWQLEDLRDELSSVLSHLAPDVLYAPSRVDFHPEHVRVAHAVSLSLPEGTLVRAYQVHVPLTAILVNLVADVTSVTASLDAAAGAYRTQRESLRRTARLRRYAARRYGLSGQAEEFWEMSAADYRLVHASLPSPDHPYRGLHYRSHLDLPAYLWGRSARRHLRDRLPTRREASA